MPTKKTTVKKRKASPKKKLKEKNGGFCFTIMPFGGWMDDYYESIYIPAIEAAGLEARRADDLYRPSTIVHDIWDFTKRSKIVLADLTGKNPNVLYELGLAHAIAKPAVLVTETLDDVPFDLRALRIIEYDKNVPDWGTVLGENIETAIKEVLASPLKSVLPAFLEVVPKKESQPISQHEKELLEIRKELDLLKKESRSRRLSTIESPPRLTLRDAQRLMISLIKNKTPHGVIVDVLSERGAPMDWAIGRLKHMTGNESLE